MSIWHIYGGNRLTGSARVQGAKNAVLPIMAASVLAGSETVLHNVPDLKDVTITLRILRHLGCTAERDGDTVRIDSRGMNRNFIPHDLMRELRSSVIFLGAILARFGTASLSMPGGCELGPRPVNLHLDALRALGAEVTERGGDIVCSAHELKGRRILLPFPSVGASENALLAACSAALNIHSIAPHEEGLCRVNVGEIHAGVCANTIAPDAMMRIEYRGQKPAISEYAGQRIFDILEGTAKAYDLKYHYVDYGEVPAGASDYAMMEVVQRAAKKVPWFQTVYFEGNVGGTDDAAVMLTKVQQNGGIGSYVGIGADTTGPVHNPEFDFDEDCLQAAMELCVYALEELHGMDA